MGPAFNSLDTGRGRGWRAAHRHVGAECKRGEEKEWWCSIIELALGKVPMGSVHGYTSPQEF